MLMFKQSVLDMEGFSTHGRSGLGMYMKSRGGWGHIGLCYRGSEMYQQYMSSTCLPKLCTIPCFVRPGLRGRLWSSEASRDCGIRYSIVLRRLAVKAEPSYCSQGGNLQIDFGHFW